MAGAQINTFEDGNFESEVLRSETPVLVDFWAPWCAPCRAIAPAVAALAETYEGRIKVGKLNVDESPQVPQRYNVRGIPSLILFKDGAAIDQIVGLVSKDRIEEMLKGAL